MFSDLHPKLGHKRKRNEMLLEQSVIVDQESPVVNIQTHDQSFRNTGIQLTFLLDE